MKYRYFSTIFLTLSLLFGFGSANAQTDSIPPAKKKYLALKTALNNLNYTQAIQWIEKKADLLYEGNVLDKDTSIISLRAPGFLYVILPPLALLRFKSTEYYRKTTFYLDLVLKDTTQSPKKLRVIEYLLQKGANPDGGWLSKKEKSAPMRLAIRNWDLKAFWLLRQYGAKLEMDATTYSAKYSCLAYLVSTYHYHQVSTKEKQRRFQQLTQTLDSLLKDPKSSPYDFYKQAMRSEKTADYFFQHIPAEKLDITKYKNPIKIAYSICNVKLIKKYKALGFNWTKEKDEALDTVLLGGENSEFLETISYYVSLGFNINHTQNPYDRTLLCKVIKYGDLPTVQKLIELGANFEAKCNPFLDLAKLRRLYRNYHLGSHEYLEQRKNNYQRAIKIESYLYKVLNSYPRKKRKALKKKLKIKQILKEYPRDKT